MLDDLDDLGDTNSFLDDIDEDDAPSSPKPIFSIPGRVLGMSPVQLFVISVELFFMICIIGFFFMMVTGKMVPSV